MNARERMLAISLMNKARDNPLFVAEIGITGVMKNTGVIKKPQTSTINEGGRSHEKRA